MTFSKDDINFCEILGKMSRKERGPNKFHFWETDSLLKPTGNEFIISDETMRTATENFAAEIGGQVSSTRKHIKMKDGTFWFCKIPG